MGRRLLPAALLSACALVGCGSQPAGDSALDRRVDQAALLSASCSGCHASGGSADGIASLDGLDADAIEARLLSYRDNSAGGSSMHRMARGYSEAQVRMIAEAVARRDGS